MAEETVGERTEPATPRKRSKAREEGNVARSQDLASGFLLLVAVLVFFFYGEYFFGQLTQICKQLLSNIDALQLSPENTSDYAMKGTFLFLQLISPILFSIAIASLVIGLIQVGFNLSAKPLTPNLKRLNPITGMQKIFSLRGIVKLGASIFKLTVIGFVLYFVLSGEMENLFFLINLEVGQILVYLGQTLFRLALWTALALFLLGIIDYSYQKWQHEKDLRMSRQEIRDEMKMVEGDPQIRARRRQIQAQIARQRMMRDVPRADVVVTNPNHLAVAIEYKDNMEAPRVVAKGADFLARKIREVADQERIPIIEKKSLAQALYRTVEVGEEVPEEFWEAVAEILAYVYRIQDRVVPV